MFSEVSPYSRESVFRELKDGSKLTIFTNSNKDLSSLLEVDDESNIIDREEKIQLLEGFSYEYEFSSEKYQLKEIPRVVKPSKTSRKNRGRITPGNYVGRLALTVISPDKSEKEVVGVEVRSSKSDYRSEYRIMLRDITTECIDLLMQHTSPVAQSVSVDHNDPSRTLYQKFSFIKSVIDSDEFRDAVHRVALMPVTTWKKTIEEKDVRRVGRINSQHVRQISSRGNRVDLSNNHSLYSRTQTVPKYLSIPAKTDTVDTIENRFVKHVLVEFERFCGDVGGKANMNHHIYTEAKDLENRLARYLSHGIFREIGSLTSLPLNNPVLQRKEGYREILKVWLMYDLAAKLTWDAQDKDVYEVGKRNVATLYEYWLFFKLLRLIENIFNVENKEIDQLIEKTKDGLGLKLKEGRGVAIKGTYSHKGRELNILYSYNRVFKSTDYPNSGSWTQEMRPDYTLSIWPKSLSEEVAETQELMTHIHFDAKYRVKDLEYLSSNKPKDNDLNKEKELEKVGKYKRADLLKMHAYKDAIRRTIGAYVLYPGSDSNTFESFHEISPGLGAFAVSPSDNGKGLDVVQSFILGVVDHVSNRASQREQLTYSTYNVYRNIPNKRNKVNESIPEFNLEGIRSTPPSETTVLVGFYKDEVQYKWIEDKGLYNIRLDTKGLQKFGVKEAGAKYLLLRASSQFKIGDIWRVVGKDPEIISKQGLLGKGYPSEPSCDNYLVYKVEKAKEGDFNNAIWDIKKLPGYTSNRTDAARPFAVTLTELLQASVPN